MRISAPRSVYSVGLITTLEFSDQQNSNNALIWESLG
jgi:hypothetical protein